MVNIGKTQLSGIDFSWNFRIPTDWGQLQWGVTGTRILKSRYQRADGQPFESDLNVDSVYSGVVVPKLRTRWHVGLQQVNWQWLAAVNHISGHDTLPFEATRVDTGQVVVLENYHVPAWWTLDLMVRHQWTPTTSFKLSVENALNRKAPLDITYTTSFNFGTNPMLANVWGRVVNLSVTHRF
jgi:outer membrane receptor protein involved in Fe transport